MVEENPRKRAVLVNKQKLEEYILKSTVDEKPCTTVVGQSDTPFMFIPGGKDGKYGDALNELLENAGLYGDVCIIVDEKSSLGGYYGYTLIGDVYKYLEKEA